MSKYVLRHRSGIILVGLFFQVFVKPIFSSVKTGQHILSFTSAPSKASLSSLLLPLSNYLTILIIFCEELIDCIIPES
jgi:hypothetical protein